MSLLSRLRQTAIYGGVRSSLRRHFSSSILSPDSKILTSKEKSRAALTLLRAEKSPSKIIEICTAANLTPEVHLDRVALSMAISKLADSNNLEFVSEYIESLKARPDFKNERFVAHAVVLYGQAKMISHAVRTFQQCEELGVKHSVKLLNSLIFACVLAKDYKEVNRAFVEFTKLYKIEPDLETYNHVILAFAESGSTSSAYSLLADMESKGIKPNSTTFQHILTGFYAEENFDEVEKVTRFMKKHEVFRGRAMYNVQIRCLCKLKRTTEAKALFDKMVKGGTKPNSVSYRELILGFCVEDRLEEAKKVWKSMGYWDVKPEIKSYYHMVSYLCKGRDFDTALEIAKESIAKDWVPNLVTMKSLVEGLVQTSKVAEAREIVSAVKEKFSKNSDVWDEIEAGLPQ